MDSQKNKHPKNIEKTGIFIDPWMANNNFLNKFQKYSFLKQLIKDDKIRNNIIHDFEKILNNIIYDLTQDFTKKIRYEEVIVEFVKRIEVLINAPSKEI